MGLKLDIHDILSRAKDLSRSNLIFIFSIIKAASIGLGVTTFLLLFLDFSPQWSWNSFWEQLPKFLLWVVSYGGLLVTFDVAIFASLFIVHIPKKSETFYTFLLVGLEALQFAILKPITDHEIKKIMSISLINYWYLIFCIYCLIIMALIIYCKSEIKPENYRAASQELVRNYTEKFKIGIYFSLSGAFLSALVFILLSFTPITSNILIIASSLVFITLFYIAFEIHHKYRRKLEKKLNEIVTIP